MASTLNALSTGSGGLVSSGDASGVLALQTNGTTTMTLDTSGNVGIGTTSPAVKFDVTGTVVASGLNARITNTDSDTSARAAIQFKTGASANVWQVFTRNNQLTFGVSGVADYATIDSSGNLLVATSSVIDSTYTMQLAVATANGFITKPTTNKTYNAAGFRNSSNSEVGYISCTASATSFGTSSDYRLKHDIAPMTGALNKVLQLKPVTYKWNIDNSEADGFIAHELAEVCPQAVHGTKDEVDADGNPVYQGIDTSFLVATLTAAIQELKAINDTQAEELSRQAATINAQAATLAGQSAALAALTARLVALESKVGG